ncbi:DUF3310 domain-containing protein [Mycobacteroides abscessus]|uniref:DUF3310 domain-containing protein n=1 Tax=Mycobacteroides abscessus TaxID=36809 RepID=UPI0009267337|nr:DUF3310 domain-containing protein [Mycobacteroides abscessus]SIM49438.1 Protein of unknwon function (DUF3310) [Mycobacteroides abscessus subsp. abscessus]SLC89424.1 Protein of unknwon function (DUF3310) [Mycobacteroides abscessus subsp. abscessus]
MSDAIDPSHYKDGFSNGAEVIDITENLNFNRGNAVKYIARAGKKDPKAEIQDLRKAKWYVDREIALVERKQGIVTHELNVHFFNNAEQSEAVVLAPHDSQKVAAYGR